MSDRDPLLDALARRRRVALAMGGPERLARQRAGGPGERGGPEGRMDVRQRADAR